ncbi:Cell wall integrity/stress response component-like protein [Melia azedarach]|uniref:Cell wall integrity/stress response component-like protein n=1 Tax=Melia azedarach TaxID=155640 RepID=A0ACC1XWA0_MELAZ|nr:Cell wall integrity/stress response component-like protein [Melia azedarach]
MAPLGYFCFRKVLLILLFLSASVLVFVSSESNDNHGIVGSKQFVVGGRRMLEIENEEDLQQLNKKSGSSSSSSSKKNQTMLIKSNLSSKNQTKSIKSSNLSSKNQTKIMKTTTVTNSTKAKAAAALSSSSGSSNLSKSELKKLNSTSKASKSSNSTKLTSPSSPKKSSDLPKTTKPTSTATSTKQTQTKETAKPKQEKNQKPQKPTKQISFLADSEDDDLVSEFRDLPIKFQQTLLPDLERISTTSKAYIHKYNKEITKGFKPYVGNKYAATIASIVSFAFIVIPLILVSLIFNRIKAYFSLQKILIFIQVYLSIYFSILCLSSFLTGLEPLKFFYSTSQSTYLCVQILQTLGYILYLLMLLMYLILVFSTDCGMSAKMMGLAQTFVGYAIGLHYYVAVFHRVVLRQPPKTDWKIHGIYATCFLVICLFATAERRKKAYLVEGGEEGKKS